MLQFMACVLAGGVMLDYVDTNSAPKPKMAGNVQVYGPITAGGAPKQLDPPEPDFIVRTLKLQNEQNLRILTELVADYSDPAIVIPLVGPAQRHVTTYRLWVNTSEGARVYWLTQQHLHLVTK